MMELSTLQNQIKGVLELTDDEIIKDIRLLKKGRLYNLITEVLWYKNEPAIESNDLLRVITGVSIKNHYRVVNGLVKIHKEVLSVDIKTVRKFLMEFLKLCKCNTTSSLLRKELV